MEGLPAAAAAAILKVAVSDVPSGDEVTFENVRPLQLVERVAPERLVPVMVTETVLPCVALDGLSPVTVGGALLVIAKLKLVDPPVAESVTGAIPTHAVEAMLNVAVAELPLEVTLLKLRPGQLVDNETLHKLLPESVTTTLPPCAAPAGLTDGAGGAGGGLTVNVADTSRHGVLSVFLTAV